MSREGDMSKGVREFEESLRASEVRGKPRAEIDPAYRWNLEDIYASEADWQKDAQRLQALVQAFASRQGTLGRSAADLLAGLQNHDEIGMVAGKLYVYAKMKLDEDTANGAAQTLFNQAMSLLVQANAATSFFVPEILSVDAHQLQAFVDATPELHVYRFALEEITRQRDHVLSPEAEQLLAQFGEVLGAPSDIFEMYNNADMVFPTIEDEHGQPVEITHAVYHELLERKDRDVRERAFTAVYDTYKRHRNTIAAVYAANVKRNAINARIRNFPSARAASLDAENIPVAVYDNLIQAVGESLPALTKYLELRKRVLGVDELQMWDLFVPLVADVDWKIPYDEAKAIVLDAVKVFGDTYRDAAMHGLNSRWVDVYETRGKRSGGYSWGTYGTHPYILLNHTDTVQDMFTLAHELGHSMHSYFSRKTQPYVYSDYTLFVAEVASTCNEAILYDYLGRIIEDPAKRAYLLNQQLETIRGTLLTQTLFAEFEKMTHDHVEQGGALTADWLDETFYQLNVKYYGDAVHVSDRTAHGWMRIPHFYSAFYVYKYATGISAAIALSRKILGEGQPAVTAYLNFLSAGSSDTSIELLRKAGVDMTSPEPVRQALLQFEQLVDELGKVL
ncbi:oligoendopeptidase F [Alicyclobacillus hesperidum subsp. aegles]|uniref:oligoendopeptidase F n=1 Tax=Alicyclobacillus hesperidum TaxID=89784 RepID=UPI00222C11B8|nr:oligoendopeptidase F [Alicyclobacillus hesperidum]GLG01783.1 oligoendopeptidase F [Alicyclobacillus hesperidum subsp. aegles]